MVVAALKKKIALAVCVGRQSVFEEDHPSIAHDIRTIVQADGDDDYRTIVPGPVRVDVRGLRIRGRNKEIAGKRRRLRLTR